MACDFRYGARTSRIHLCSVRVPSKHRRARQLNTRVQGVGLDIHTPGSLRTRHTTLWRQPRSTAPKAASHKGEPGSTLIWKWNILGATDAIDAK